MSKGNSNEDFDMLIKKLKTKFESGETRTYSWRIAQMQALRRMIVNHENEFLDALASDLRRPLVESVAAETATMVGAIDHAVKNLKTFMKPQPFDTFALSYPSTTTVQYEPFGLVLVIAPFNFPFMLALKPFLGAIMAGNCAVIKTSEYCHAVSSALKKYFPLYMDMDAFGIVEGGVKETEEILSRQWDFIFFTGSPRVGKIIAQAAAQHLTPYILELGGKNPVIVDKHVEDLDVVAKRLIWGRCYNAGQICLSPEYVLCHEDHVERLTSLLAKYIRVFYGENPQESGDLGRMITKEAAKRVKNLLIDRKNGKIETGGKVDEEDRYVAPTILSDPDYDSPIMKAETFAPVLTINRVRSLDEAVSVVEKVSGKAPLALYIFSNRQTFIDGCLSRIQSGGAVVNDCLLTGVNPTSAFGGLGTSGSGCYQGKYSFEAFSHKRTVVRKHLNLNNMLCDPDIRYPPFTQQKTKWFLWACRRVGMIPSVSWAQLAAISLLVVLSLNPRGVLSLLRSSVL